MFDGAPNTLIFPAGTPSGFNHKHLAALKTKFSGVALPGSGFLNILTGQVGTQAATVPTASMMDKIGPTIYQSANGNTTFAYEATSWPLQTMAAIVQFDAATGASPRIIQHTAALGVTGMSISASNTAEFAFSFGLSTVTLGSSAPVVAGVPYFFAVSFVSGERYNFVLRRLDTGVLLSGGATSAITALAGDATLYIGNRGTNSRQTIGKIAATMHSTAFHSKEALMAWSERPWSFWYPDRAD